MEIQFEKRGIPCLHRVLREYQMQEQTLEVRLPEGMPDIGQVLCCWGQVILRSKEWRGDSVGVSGGVMARVLYIPEGGGAPQSIDGWLPFQMKWSIPQSPHDGSLIALPMLRSADARSLSARKLMLRTNVGVLLQGWISGVGDVYTPGDIPGDVQLLKESRCVCVPKEAGEKAFQLEETLEMGTGEPKLEKLMRCSLQPEITEKKLMGDKIVFRGIALVHILYRAEDGNLYSRDFDVPYSQYGELDGEYLPESHIQLTPVVTNLELEPMEDGTLHLKAGLTGQYLICQDQTLELVTDAYSHCRELSTLSQSLQLPTMLEMTQERIRATVDTGVDMQRCADACFMPEHPRTVQEDQRAEGELTGVFQTLFYDPEGQLDSALTRWETLWQKETLPHSNVEFKVLPTGMPQVSPTDSAAQADLILEAVTMPEEALSMVTGLELGQEAEPDPKRPALVLQRPEGRSLWELAKATGSTVEAILRANGLEAEPADDRFLLIPVL